MDTTVHEHHLVQVVSGLEREFRLFIGEEWMELRAVLIDADIPHRFDSEKDWHAVLLADPEMDTAAAIKSRLRGESHLSLEYDRFKDISGMLLECSSV